jgi:hypothetical protein
LLGRGLPLQPLEEIEELNQGLALFRRAPDIWEEFDVFLGESLARSNMNLDPPSLHLGKFLPEGVYCMPLGAEEDPHELLWGAYMDLAVEDEHIESLNWLFNMFVSRERF